MESFVYIIVPVYNAAKTINSAIASVLAQDYNKWRCILVDDCSTDNSKKVIEKFASEDDRIVVLSTDINSGPAHSRNVGIEYAIEQNADYLAFLDSDDELEHKYLTTLVNTAILRDADLVWCNYYEYEFGQGERKRTISHSLPIVKPLEKNQLINCFFEDRQGLGSMCNKLYKVEFIAQHNLRINEERVRAEDWEFNFMAFQCCPKVMAIEDALYNYIHYPSPSVMRTFRKKDFEMYKRSLSLLSDVANKYGLQQEMKGRYANFLYNSICYIVQAISTKQDSKLIYNTCNDSLFRSVVSDFSMYGNLTLKQKVYAILIRYKMYAFLQVLIKKC